MPLRQLRLFRLARLRGSLRGTGKFSFRLGAVAHPAESSARFAMCCRRSIFGAGYSPRRATFLSFGEKKEGKESASIQYHGLIHVCGHDGGD